MTLQITERQGVEIDFCPECRGVWLDSGELDKIIDRSKSFDQPQYSKSHYKKRKRKHILEEIFDIFD
jgi:Zn-finger nucleic acid-binding protein